MDNLPGPWREKKAFDDDPKERMKLKSHWGPGWLPYVLAIILFLFMLYSKIAGG